MKKFLALVLATLVLGCVTSVNKEFSAGADGSVSLNKTLGGPTTTQAKKAATTTHANNAPTTTATAKITTTTLAQEPAGAGIALTFTPDQETVSLSDEFMESLTFTNLDTAHNYTVAVLMYSPGGSGDGGQDVNMVSADPVAREWGIMNFTFGMAITPFTHKEDGYASEMDHFTRKGEHNYDISVYDCTLIEEATGAENCGRGERQSGQWENPDGWKGQEPVFHQIKVITVA